MEVSVTKVSSSQSSPFLLLLAFLGELLWNLTLLIVALCPTEVAGGELMPGGEVA